MAVNDYESAYESGQPVELYEFVYGQGSDGQTPQVFRYTNAERGITVDGQPYEPLPIDRSNLKATVKFKPNEVTIPVPRTSGIAQLFLGYPSTQPVAARILVGHLPNGGDPAAWATGDQFVVRWIGTAIEGARDEAICNLTCVAASAGMSRPGLRRHYQRSCPHVLYGPRCQASKAAATASATVSAVDGNKVTLADGFLPAGRSYGDYVGGTVEWLSEYGNEVRTILSMSDARVATLSGPARGVEASDAVDVVFGCAHNLTACEELHENAINFGGFFAIPKQNPVGKNNHT